MTKMDRNGRLFAAAAPLVSYSPMIAPSTKQRQLPATA